MPSRLAQAWFSLVELLGIDRAVSVLIVSRVWGLWSGPVTLFFIGRFLSPAEQGFYYTFYSVIALNIFLELGLSTVLIQFASHECAHLSWTESGILDGSDVAKRRLAAILRQSMRWYGVAALLVCVTTLPGGLYFFSHNGASMSIAWRGPWVLLSAVSALNLALIPLFAIFEGSGRVSTVVSIRACQVFAAGLALWLALVLKFALFAAPAYQTASVLVAAGAFWFLFRRCLSDLARVDARQSNFSWRKEVWPFQWKIAVSSLSSYFIYQLANPVLFAYHGAIEAGKMGMSTTLVNAMQGTCSAWIMTKAAPFGTLIARKEFHKLDRLFFRTFLQSSAIFCLGASTFFGILLYLKHAGFSFTNRILDPLPFGLMIGTGVLNHIVFSQAVYLRAHKQEPFLWPSVASAVAVSISTWFLGRSFGALGILTGSLVAGLTIGVGPCTYIFFRKRREWHSQDVQLEPGTELAASMAIDKM